MSEKNDSINRIDILELAKQIIPQPAESKPVANDVWVRYGIDNLYPNFLLNLYAKCPIHHSIIDTKASYIIGDGLKRKGGGDLNFKPNGHETIEEFIEKIVKDFLIHNAFAIETQYNELTFSQGPMSYNHVPAYSIRMNKQKTEFWYSEDWSLKREEFRYSEWVKTSTDSKSKLFWYDGYIPSINKVYVDPDYTACIESIVTDMSIRLFNRNNITSNFSPSKLITYYLGENVPKNIQDDIKRKIDRYFSGAGEKYMLVFANPGQEKMRVDNIDANSWDRAYEVTREAVKDDIYQGHGINAALLGKETAGKLGNTQELELSYEIFKSNYIQSKRIQLESALSTLFGFEVEFSDRPLFKTRLSDTAKEKVYTINEMRALENLPPLPDGDKLLTTSTPQQPQQPIQQQMSKVERKLTEADFELVKDMGTPKVGYEFICFGDEEELSKVQIKLDNQEDIRDYVLSNDIKGLTLKQLRILIRKDLGLELSLDELRNTLINMSNSGIISMVEDGDKIRIKPPVEAKLPSTRAITVMYEYEVKPGLGQPLISTSRDFCVKLIENNRYYTRSEIQKMSELFGYDVFSYTGGYYYNPQTGETTPSCRHKWSAVIVTGKNNQQ